MKYPDTQFLRALAILLVINSHLDRYYPIPYIGTGGAIGNSIFFFLSAFGLYLSQQKQSQYFKEWSTHRISRIYPSLWIVLISLFIPVLIWQDKLSYNTIPKAIDYFFNPPFWFLQALLVYYLLAYPLFKNIWKIKLWVILGFLGIVYATGYLTVVDLSKWSVEESPFDLIHYFMIFIFGIFIAKKNKDIVCSGIKDYFISIVVVGLIYLHKFLMLKGFCLEYQFLQQLAMYPLVFYLIKISRSPFIITRLMRSPRLSRPVDFLANHTLEIYMVHQTISAPILHMQMPLPLNILVFLGLTFSLSAIVNRLATSVRQKIL